MREKLPPIGHIVVALMAISAGQALAQVQPVQTPLGPQAMVGSAFTYQGQLTKAGSPVNATCDLTFKLFDASTTPPGVQVGSTVTKTAVAVAQGLFTVSVDFGAASFQGDERWLEIAAKCPGDASFVTLSPRQGLTPAPYALSFRPNAAVTGVVDNYAVLTVTNTSGSVAPIGILGVASSWQQGIGLGGHATSATGMTYGVYGRADSDAGVGVYGTATNSNGTSYGVYATSSSGSGTGVYGEGLATSGTTYGVYGKTNSTSGYGVYGLASGVNGEAVHGEANRYAVQGHTSATTGPSAATAGTCESDAGTAVWGYAKSATGVSYGVSGRSNSTGGYGVSGYVPAATGTNYGVYGKSDSTGGRGVAGHATADTGTNYGVLGRTDSSSGYGLYSVGNFGASGTKAAVVRTAGHGWRHLYSMESPAVLFEDVGSAKLNSGKAVVEIDPIFAQTVNLDVPYQVFVTAEGDVPVLLWVAAKTSTSFTVRGVTLDGHAATGSFDYRIIAKRLGYEDVRLNAAAEPPSLADATTPDPPQH